MDFSLETLTAAINTMPHLPTQLGDSGLFTYAGVPTLSVDIERDGFALQVVGTAPRGAAGQAIGRKKRDTINFKIPHLPQEDAIMADEVQGVRAFGTTEQPEPLQNRMNEVLAIGSNNNDLTLEIHRVGALKGIVYDKDGAVLYDFYNEFGVTQQTIDFELDVASTDVRSKCDQLLDLIADELGGMMMTGAIAFCGRDYYRAMHAHKSVKESYLATAAAADLRSQIPDSFDYGGVTWVKYRGAIGGVPMIANNEAYIVPTGVPDLLIGRFAPAPYSDTVNTIGLPMYARAFEKRNGTGWDVEMQSNPIHINTRPRAILRATI
jgi:hypothetical protein